MFKTLSVVAPHNDIQEYQFKQFVTLNHFYEENDKNKNHLQFVRSQQTAYKKQCLAGINVLTLVFIGAFIYLEIKCIG